ncbi:MAG: cobalamin B12-binding domain-containing protein [Promethearchaeota archaeon]
MDKELFDSFVDLQEDKVLNIVKEKIESGEDAFSIAETCKKALIKIGDLFSRKEYFLSELVMSGEIFREVMEMLEPKLVGDENEGKKIGKIVIGTVKGDIHDLGKNIMIGTLKGNGFEVYDLGVDVPPKKFVENVREIEPDILGMSCIISVGWDSLKETVDALKRAGLRDKVKIILGGGGVDEEVAKFAGADAVVKDAIEGVEQCKRWVSI